MTVALLGFLYGLSRPSPTPVYKEQNSLPPLLSGQVPYFLFTVTIMNTSTYIASYLRFWKVSLFQRRTCIDEMLSNSRLPFVPTVERVVALSSPSRRMCAHTAT